MKQSKYDPGADVKSVRRSHHYLARLALPLLLAVALLPEIVIFAVAALASLMGCEPVQKEACLIGPLAVSDVIDWALLAGGVSILYSAAWRSGFYLAVAGGLVLCYIVLIQGWARITSRLLLGSAVALFFALLPLAGPGLAITTLAKQNICDPEGGHDCLIFGGKVDKAYAAVSMAQPPIFDTIVLLAFGSLGIYATLVILLAIVPAARPAKSKQQSS